ncbi:MAG: MaoC family dehydratase [Actinomycetota bacterium]
MSGTFDALQVGQTFVTPAHVVTDEDHASLVARGGYTHPLFTDASFAATTPLGRSPLPGQAVLLLMGGLVEQSGRFDDTVIALVGFEEVLFRRPVFPGDTIRVEVSVDSKEPRDDGRRGLLGMTWRCVNDRDEAAVEASAHMLFRRD